MPGIRLELLGGFEILTAAGAPVAIPARKVRALFAYLALSSGRAHSRDKLGALLWGDAGEEQARTSLRQALSVLRKAFAPRQLVQADADSVVLAPEGWSCDACRFARLAEAGGSSAQEAAALYRGDLLEGFYVPAPAFEEWLVAERERLRALALRVLLGLLEAHSETGAHEQAAAVGARLLALDPLREDVHRSLMQLYLRQGRQAAALRQYRLCRAALQRELGVSPEPETERLHREILLLRRSGDIDAGTGDPGAGDAEAGGEPAVAAQPVRAAPGGKRAEAAKAPSAAGPELRESVVLCAELDGFATLAREGDPEAVHAMLSGFRERFNEPVADFGGVVVSHAGARAMAVFGTPLAHGNEAERALRAALAVRDGNDAPATGVRVAVRIGLAAGQVLATRDELGLAVSGEPVEAAARIMEAAPAGEVWLSHRVRHSLAGRVEAQPVSAEREPRMQLWRATGCPGGAAADQTAPFVGRHHELNQLDGIVAHCASGGLGQVVLLRGEAGIGKSRLAEELGCRAQARGFACHRAQVLDFGGAADPVPTLFASLLGLAPRVSAAERETAVAEAVSAGRLAPALRVFACDLLDLLPPAAERADFEAMDGAARARGRRAALLHLAREASARGPLAVLVEDIHWADPGTLDELAHLAAALADRPTVLIMTTRPEGDPVDAAWRVAAHGCRLTTLDLGPLAAAEAFDLARHYPAGDEAFARACVLRAEGNPLFLDQLLRAAGSSPGLVPGSLQGLVLARLDRLEPGDRTLLQAAAVLGQRFSSGPLQHLLGGGPPDCRRLAGHGLLRRDGDDYRFVHALIHEAVHASILKSRRQAWHRQAAEWFRGRDPELVARHLDAAADPAAADAYLAAARAEAARHRHEGALRWVERGLDLATERGLQYELVSMRAELLRELGDSAASVDGFRQAVELARDEPQRCLAWLGVAAALRILDRYEEALAALANAEAAAQGPECAQALARIHGMRGNIHFPLGEVEACLAAHEKARAAAARCGSPAQEAEAIGGLGDAWYQRGRMRTAREHFARCVDIARSGDLRRIEVATLPMLAVTALYCLELAQARADAESAVHKAQAIGDLRGRLLGHMVASSVAIYSGDAEDERRHAACALELSRRLGARRFEAEALAGCAHAALSAGRRGEARRLFEEADAVSRAVGERYIGPLIQGWASLAEDDPACRRQRLAHGEALLAQGCVSHCHLHFHEAAIDVALSAGDWDEAERHAAALAAYTRDEPLPWADFVIDRARELARLGRVPGDPEALQALRRLRDRAREAGMPRVVAALGAVPGLAPR